MTSRWHWDKYYIIAGNQKEFSEFINYKIADLWSKNQTYHTFSNFVYLDNPDQLLGIVDPHGWLVGTWRKRENIRDLIAALIIKHTHNGNTHDGLVDIWREVQL